jgi:hypothetical protein
MESPNKNPHTPTTAEEDALLYSPPRSHGTSSETSLTTGFQRLLNPQETTAMDQGSITSSVASKSSARNRRRANAARLKAKARDGEIPPLASTSAAAPAAPTPIPKVSEHTLSWVQSHSDSDKATLPPPPLPRFYLLEPGGEADPPLRSHVLEPGEGEAEAAVAAAVATPVPGAQVLERRTAPMRTPRRPWRHQPPLNPTPRLPRSLQQEPGQP